MRLARRYTHQDMIHDSTGCRIPFAHPAHFSRFHSPYYKDTHYKFAARVQRFVDNEILPTMDQWCGRGLRAARRDSIVALGNGCAGIASNLRSFTPWSAHP